MSRSSRERLRSGPFRVIRRRTRTPSELRKRPSASAEIRPASAYNEQVGGSRVNWAGFLTPSIKRSCLPAPPVRVTWQREAAQGKPGTPVPVASGAGGVRSLPVEPPAGRFSREKGDLSFDAARCADRWPYLPTFLLYVGSPCEPRELCARHRNL